MKKKLSPRSQEVVDRFVIHRDRCLKIKEHFGTKVAEEYHKEYKSRPGDPEAEVCFNQFMTRLN